MEYPATLTAYEKNLLAMVAAGLSNDEIAAVLMVGVAMVRSQRKRLAEKLALPDTDPDGMACYARRYALQERSR